ncbi:hypothetical protein [Acetobacter conturbans]|uniref:Uncharacterized protein n=1 Tax=Acetobacter conturbans TaxID=1737472 RepID=A0ABX0K146_9PROT|nr:hypothetical protein [Acetobacter conturbans]NHN89321.1 hypothetical protein [Acetobacter conturbans]
MQGMTPEFQKRQRPAAVLLIAASVAAAGALVTLVRKVAGSRTKSDAGVKTAVTPTPATPAPAPAAAHG